MKTFTRLLQSLVYALLSILVFSSNSQAQTSGILTGMITDCYSGSPVVGAKVMWGTYFTYSLAGGVYSMTVYTTGPQAFSVTKTGYMYPQAGVTVTLGGTTTVNVSLNPVLNGSANVMAALNAGQTAADLSWNLPTGDVELMYDDMAGEQCLQYQNAGCKSAVKFTPSAYPAVVNKCSFSLCGTLSNFVPFNAYVYNADGPGGLPGTILAGPVSVSPFALGWITCNLPAPVTINSGSYYIVMEQVGNFPNCAGLQVDTTTTQMRSVQKIGTGPWMPAGGNYLIHAIITEPGGLINPGNITYTIYRFIQGQEGTPALWTAVGTTTGAYSMTDNNWSSLPCSPYRWAVKANYTCSPNMSPVFSNALGKCWTADVTFHGQKCCSIFGKDHFPVTAQNVDLADTVYLVYSDTSGTVMIQNMWKGHYMITSAIFGCMPVTVFANIIGDTTINMIMNMGPKLPPYGLYVNDSTLLATWNPPAEHLTIFQEPWTSNAFTTNGWTVSGGTNWQISPTIGNPGSSAMFYYSPAVQNYDQYLMSRIITDSNTSRFQLFYDIQLNNFGTTAINMMAVEVWDGSTWNNVKTYDNSGGNISWTSEVIDIPNIETFKFRFHASGVDSYYINNWNIDNIKVDTWRKMPCVLGYVFSLYGALSPFVADTFYQIPSNHVIPGHTYHACVEAVYEYGISSQNCFDFTDSFYPPPVGFNADSIDCSAYLTWHKPLRTDGSPSPGVIGYNIYRGPNIIHYCPSVDSLSYYDNDLDPGDYIYSCSAKYDRSVYGFPGLYGYSKPLCAVDTATIVCGDQMPFMEQWSLNNFSYNVWTFDPSQGNWTSNSITGNPAPSADFSFSGKKTTGDVNYDYSMVSRIMDGSEWTCSHLFLDFDLKLVDHNSTSSEMITVEIMYDHTWHPVGEFTNNGSFGWDTESFNIDQLRGKGFRVRFRAHGANTNNILHWYIDNIHLYGNCLPPAALQWTANSQEISLAWTALCSNIAGYNIFRSNAMGNPPYIRINAALVTGTAFTDTPPGWSQNDSYRYYVTALQMNNATGTALCEPSSDTILVAYSTGIPIIPEAKINIYPNPADNYFMMQSDQPLTKVEVIAELGKVVFNGNYSDEKELRINTNGFSQGIYFVRLTTDKGIFFRKIVICR